MFVSKRTEIEENPSRGLVYYYQKEESPISKGAKQNQGQPKYDTGPMKQSWALKQTGKV